MGLLQQVMRGRRPAPRRVMVYGVQGVGKSTFGAASNRPIFIQTEDGLGEIAADKFPLAGTTADVIAAIAELHSEQHDYASVVLDSLDWLRADDLGRRLPGVQRQVSRKGRWRRRQGLHVYAASLWHRAGRLRCPAPRSRHDGGAVAHAKSEKFQTPEDTAHDRFAPRLHKLASALIQEWCDEVFFATYTAITDPKKVKVGEPPERVMRTCEGPTHVAKNRLNMPPELPLVWEAYDYYIHQAHDNLSTPLNGDSANG